jgi:hypothetical protein
VTVRFHTSELVDYKQEDNGRQPLPEYEEELLRLHRKSDRVSARTSVEIEGFERTVSNAPNWSELANVCNILVRIDKKLSDDVFQKFRPNLAEAVESEEKRMNALYFKSLQDKSITLDFNALDTSDKITDYLLETMMGYSLFMSELKLINELVKEIRELRAELFKLSIS